MLWRDARYCCIVGGRRARSRGPSLSVAPVNRRTVACALGALAGAIATPASDARESSVARAEHAVAEANDNRRAAGVRRGDTVFVALEVRLGRWYPEASDGDFIETPLLAEVGEAPQVPGPLLRIAEGTTIVARLTNALADSTVTWYGLSRRPGNDSVQLRPGATTTVRFLAGAPGTYLYRAQAGTVDWAVREREQLAGALVVDARGARTDDRVFVINVWGEPGDSGIFRNALAINGRGWPYTERVHATRGDTLRWRVVNASIRPHPMHLHGFYYHIEAKGDGVRDSRVAPRDREQLVTEPMDPFSTMAMTWVAEREGNWLFHCHLFFHVAADTRFAKGVDHADHMSGNAARHMAGLVLGIEVAAGTKATQTSRAGARSMRLLVQEGTRRGRAARTLGFVLQGAGPTARDSVRIPGSALDLTRGQPTDITVVNHLSEATAVHWHGIELESYSDGVAGWSGAMQRLAPIIAPGDSFTAHLTLPRAGTFIYHTHLNDVEQLTSGLYGAIIVREPGARIDPRTDHLFVVGWDGPEDPPHLLVNGDSLPPPLMLEVRRHHRLRFVFIGAVGGERFTLHSRTSVARWRSLARDGQELAPSRQLQGTASITGWAGQTYDFDFFPSTPGEYTLTAGEPAKPEWSQRVLVVPRRPR
jgi:manganese oxidase